METWKTLFKKSRREFIEGDRFKKWGLIKKFRKLLPIRLPHMILPLQLGLSYLLSVFFLDTSNILISI